MLAARTRRVEFFAIGVCCVMAAVMPRPALQAQEQVTIPRQEYEALKRQAQEAVRLSEELQRVREELERLREPQRAAPERVVGEPSPVSRPAGIPSGESVPVVAAELPPPADPSTTLEATDIIRHFAMNPQAAAERYRRTGVRLRGTISAFAKPAFRRDYEIVFRTAAGQLTCRVAPPQHFNAVFTTRSGLALTGRTDRGAEVELFKVGDTVEIQGSGQGMKDGTILFTRCRVEGTP